MDRTIRVLLEPSPEQRVVLDDTLAQFTAAFNHVCKTGWGAKEKNGVTLHHATYRPLKDRYPNLVSDHHIQARMKATEAVRSALTLQAKGKKVGMPQSRNCPARYNLHTYRMDWDARTVNLSSTEGRLIIPFHVPAYAARYIGSRTVTADLVSRKGKLWLHVVVDLPTPDIAQADDVLGIDLGLSRPAVTSTALFFGERRWRELEARTFRQKRSRQRKGTRSAKRGLRRLSGKQLRRRRDHDHVLSRRIVDATPPGGVIVLENLKEIRSRVKQRKGKQSRRLHGWSFAQLKGFIEYKAEERGIRVVTIDPRNTSRACSRCSFTHKGNRPSQSVFQCKDCGFQLNADLNAARNIARKYLVSSGMSAADGLLSTSLMCQTAPAA